MLIAASRLQLKLSHGWSPVPSCTRHVPVSFLPFSVSEGDIPCALSGGLLKIQKLRTGEASASCRKQLALKPTSKEDCSGRHTR